MSIFMKGEKERLIQAVSLTIRKYPISVDSIIRSIDMAGILSQYGIDFVELLKKIKSQINAQLRK